MIKEKAIIIKKDQKFYYLKILSQNNEGCSSCKAKYLCNINDKEFRIPISKNDYDFNVNETVFLIVDNISILKLSFIVYGIPFLFTISGIFIGYFLLFKKYEENIKVLLSFLFSIISLTLSLLLVKVIDKKISKKFTYRIEKY